MFTAGHEFAMMYQYLHYSIERLIPRSTMVTGSAGSKTLMLVLVAKSPMEFGVPLRLPLFVSCVKFVTSKSDRG